MTNKREENEHEANTRFMIILHARKNLSTLFLFIYLITSLIFCCKVSNSRTHYHHTNTRCLHCRIHCLHPLDKYTVFLALFNRPSNKPNPFFNHCQSVSMSIDQQHPKCKKKQLQKSIFVYGVSYF